MRLYLYSSGLKQTEANTQRSAKVPVVSMVVVVPVVPGLPVGPVVPVVPGVMWSLEFLWFL